MDSCVDGPAQIWIDLYDLISVNVSRGKFRVRKRTKIDMTFGLYTMIQKQRPVFLPSSENELKYWIHISEDGQKMYKNPYGLITLHDENIFIYRVSIHRVNFEEEYVH
jgi:hypothetical protein